jgi:hypothetical protein
MAKYELAARTWLISGGGLCSPPFYWGVLMLVLFLIVIAVMDASCLAPPAGIRTCTLMHGSYLGCLTAKRWLGQG